VAGWNNQRLIPFRIGRTDRLWRRASSKDREAWLAASEGSRVGCTWRRAPLLSRCALPLLVKRFPKEFASLDRLVLPPAKSA